MEAPPFFLFRYCLGEQTFVRDIFLTLFHTCLIGVLVLRHILSMTLFFFLLAHWGRVTHICISKLTIIGSDNGLSPGRRQAIFWTNAGILLIGSLGTNLSEILIEIQTFSLKKMHLKMLSAKRWPFCLGLNVLNNRQACAWGHLKDMSVSALGSPPLRTFLSRACLVFSISRHSSSNQGLDFWETVVTLGMLSFAASMTCLTNGVRWSWSWRISLVI